MISTHTRVIGLALAAAGVISACGTQQAAPYPPSTVCKAPSQIQAQASPPELYLAAADCARKDRYDEGAYHLLLANAYLAVDGRRVRNPDMSRGGLSFQYVEAVSPAQGRALYQAAARLGAPDQVATTCQTLKQIGIPRYLPDYLVGDKSKVEVRQMRPNEKFVMAYDLSQGFADALHKPLGCPR